MIEGEGACDGPDADPFDDYEVAFAPGGVAGALEGTADCISPRTINIVVIRDWADPEGGGKTYQVQGFATMFFVACQRPGGPVDRDCSSSGGGAGHLEVRAIFVKLITSGSMGGGGSPDMDFGTRVVALIE